MKKSIFVLVILVILAVQRSSAQDVGSLKELEKLKILNSKLNIRHIGKCKNVEFDGMGKMMPGAPDFVPCFMFKQSEKVSLIYYIGIGENSAAVFYVLKMTEGEGLEVVYNGFLDAYQQGFFKPNIPSPEEQKPEKKFKGPKVGPF